MDPKNVVFNQKCIDNIEKWLFTVLFPYNILQNILNVVNQHYVNKNV